MGSIFNKQDTENFLNSISKDDVRGRKLSTALLNQFRDFHSLNIFDDKEIEELLLKQKQHEVATIGQRGDYDYSLTKFSPSSANACDRGLYFKNIKAPKDERVMYPYQRRWVNNGSAIHERAQRDLLYMEKFLDSPAFKVARQNGLPAWEKNIKTFEVFEIMGERFVLTGMSDGILIYVPEKKPIGFEFKTKSTTLGAVGHYKLKKPQDSHVAQQVGYSLLFNIDEFLIVYESLAKDGWNKGADAKPDMRAFYHRVTQEDKAQLLHKFANVAKHVRLGTPPAGEFDKCIFCEYKNECKKVEESK